MLKCSHPSTVTHWYSTGRELTKEQAQPELIYLQILQRKKISFLSFTRHRPGLFQVSKDIRSPAQGLLVKTVRKLQSQPCELFGGITLNASRQSGCRDLHILFTTTPLRMQLSSSLTCFSDCSRFRYLLKADTSTTTWHIEAFSVIWHSRLTRDGICLRQGWHFWL